MENVYLFGEQTYLPVDEQKRRPLEKKYLQTNVSSWKISICSVKNPGKGASGRKEQIFSKIGSVAAFDNAIVRALASETSVVVRKVRPLVMSDEELSFLFYFISVKMNTMNKNSL